MRMLALFLSGLLLFSGCSTTGGTLGGLIPAPKFWKGKVDQGTYTSPKGDFRLTIPQYSDKYEFDYLQVKEQLAPDGSGTYVSFGPAAIDHSIYRVQISSFYGPDDKQLSLDAAADRTFAFWGQTLENGYQAPLERLALEQTTFQGNPAVLAIFQQSSKWKGYEGPLYYTMLYTQANKTHVALCAEVRGADLRSPKGIKEQILNKSYKPVNEFLDSFELINPGQ